MGWLGGIGPKRIGDLLVSSLTGVQLEPRGMISMLMLVGIG